MEEYRKAWNRLKDRMDENGWTATSVRNDIKKVEEAINKHGQLEEELIESEFRT